MCKEICTEICIGTCIGMCTGTCIDMCVDICIDICVDAYIDICIGMHVYKCTSATQPFVVSHRFSAPQLLYGGAPCMLPAETSSVGRAQAMQETAQSLCSAGGEPRSLLPPLTRSHTCPIQVLLPTTHVFRYR